MGYKAIDYKNQGNTNYKQDLMYFVTSSVGLPSPLLSFWDGKDNINPYDIARKSCK